MGPSHGSRIAWRIAQHGGKHQVSPIPRRHNGKAFEGDDKKGSFQHGILLHDSLQMISMGTGRCPCKTLLSFITCVHLAQLCAHFTKAVIKTRVKLLQCLLKQVHIFWMQK